MLVVEQRLRAVADVYAAPLSPRGCLSHLRWAMLKKNKRSLGGGFESHLLHRVRIQLVQGHRLNRHDIRNGVGVNEREPAANEILREQYETDEERGDSATATYPAKKGRKRKKISRSFSPCLRVSLLGVSTP